MRTFRKLFRTACTALALGLVATAAATAQTSEAKGRLKICKVAGPGVQVGELFKFTIGTPNTTIQVPAGPAPGGTCKVVPTSYPIHNIVKITETSSNGSQVTDIKVDPPNREVPGTLDLAQGTVSVQIGSGVTEVTFTNKRTGYLEICKETKPPGGTGTYTFWAYAGGTWFGPYTVPAGSCTHAIEVPAGSVDIWEWPGSQLLSCSVISGGSQVACYTLAGGSTVTVNPGDVSNQTIAVLTNKGGHIIDDPTTTTHTDDPN